jgi:hypothetical protein
MTTQSKEIILVALSVLVIVLGAYVTTYLTVMHVLTTATEVTIGRSGWQNNQVTHVTKLTRNKEGEARCMLDC